MEKLGSGKTVNGVPIRIGMVGAGGIAHSHLAAWQRLGVSVQVYSVDGRASEVAALYGATASPDIARLIYECDVVDVCSPTSTHPDIVQAAAAAGRDIICEKPLALTHHQAAQMIDVCANAGVLLLPGQVVRFFPEYVAAHDAVAAGRIGTPAVLRLSRRGPAPGPAWFADEELSGGLMVDQMIHDFDYARWIAGEVATVYAKLVPGLGRTITGYAVLRHTSGALSQLTGGWGSSDEVFTTTFSLAGSTGLVLHDSSQSAPVTWSGRDDRVGEVIPGGTVSLSPFDDELGEFLATIAKGAQPRVNAADSLAALDIALAARLSARSGRPVSPKEVAA